MLTKRATLDICLCFFLVVSLFCFMRTLWRVERIHREEEHAFEFENEAKDDHDQLDYLDE